jgi:nitrogen PTS system EIIA component
MKLNFVFRKNCIIRNFQNEAGNKSGIINEIFDLLYKNTSIATENIYRKTLVNEILKREKEQTTALGEGFAFPHARIEGLKFSYSVFAVSQKGVNFESLDNKPTHFFIFNLVPVTQPNYLLKTRAGITRLLSSPDIKNNILSADSVETISNIISDSNIEVGHDIIASDIMRPQVGCISKNATLKDAARTLHKCHTDTLPVLDDNNILHGIISCHDLFSYGMPKFFHSLHQISFVKHMDPFEKYFKVDESLTVEMVQTNKKLPVISPTSTIMEIIFEMTVNNNETLYVVNNEKKLLGTLDRYTIIDKILVAV